MNAVKSAAYTIRDQIGGCEPLFIKPDPSAPNPKSEKALVARTEQTGDARRDFLPMLWIADYLCAMRLAFIALLFSGAFTAVADDSPIVTAKDVGEIVPGPGNTGDVHYADLIKATREFDAVFVWEGTPRRNTNKPGASDSAPEKTFKVGDQAFYAIPLGLSEQETAAVSDAVLKHKENFAPWSGIKFCGGFHANYAIQWREKGVTVGQVLLCFTCEEARIYVGNGLEVVDQSSEGATRFRALLSSHHHEIILVPGEVLNPPRVAAPKINVSTPPSQ